MARNYNIQDAYDIVNAMLDNIQGLAGSLTVVDTSSFIDAGEAIKSQPTEDTLNALSIVMARTLVAVRPYDAKLGIFNAIDGGIYSNRMRKISYYSTDPEYVGGINNQLHINHADGFDNGRNGTQTPAPGTPPEYPDGFTSAASMWKQEHKHPLEIAFGGGVATQTRLTLLEDNIERAFRSEDDFMRFWDGMLADKANDIEQMKEAFNYALLDNVIGATYLLNNGRQVVNLTKLFNDTFGTSYTSQQLRTTYFTEFLEFFVAEIRKISDLLTHRTAVFHQPVTATFNGVSQSILRHTPKDRQRLLLYNPMFIDAQARVFPEIFNERYLKMENYEGVDFWQDFNTPESVYVTPSFPDYVTAPETKTAEIPYVVGLLYDVDAIMTQFILDRVATSPLEAAKLYRNTIWHLRKNYIYDATENIVLFVMEDPAGGDGKTLAVTKEEKASEDVKAEAE